MLGLQRVAGAQYIGRNQPLNRPQSVVDVNAGKPVAAGHTIHKYDLAVDSLYSYSGFQYMNREYWWTQLHPAWLKQQVVHWNEDKHRRAQISHIVSIFVEGHGSKKPSSIRDGSPLIAL